MIFYWGEKFTKLGEKTQRFLISIYKFLTKFAVFLGEENCDYFGDIFFTKYGQSLNLSLYLSKKKSQNLVISSGKKKGIFVWSFCH